MGMTNEVLVSCGECDGRLREHVDEVEMVDPSGMVMSMGGTVVTDELVVNDAGMK